MSQNLFAHLQQVPRWRLGATGAAVYLLSPVLLTPPWQLTYWQAPTQTSQQLQPLLAFYQQYGEDVLPALAAQIQLERLQRLEKSFYLAQADFASQSTDESWAEATEYLLWHLAENMQPAPLVLKERECRNNLCRIKIVAPQGLTPDFQARVLQFASTLKTANLEFMQLWQGQGDITLEFKADKKLKLPFWQQWQIRPSLWQPYQQEIQSWLQQSTANS